MYCETCILYNSVGLIQDLLAVHHRLSTTTVLRPSRCAAETVPTVSIEGRATSCKSESSIKKAGKAVGGTRQSWGPSARQQGAISSSVARRVGASLQTVCHVSAALHITHIITYLHITHITALHIIVTPVTWTQVGTTCQSQMRSWDRTEQIIMEPVFAVT